MPSGERRQFLCESCNRVWIDFRTATSTCFTCHGEGELVPVGQEIELHQFQCSSNDCGGQAWYARQERCVCRDCGVIADPLPAGRVVEYRQFVCENQECIRIGHRWEKMANRSKCRYCDHYGNVVPTGQEIGVFICKFKCDCTQCSCPTDRDLYTVRCRMQCTAVCYRCRRIGHEDFNNSPYAFRPLRYGIRRQTDNIHSCSDCNGGENCPNMSAQHNH